MHPSSFKKLSPSQVLAQDHLRRRRRMKVVKAVRHAAQPAWVMNALLRHSLGASADGGDAVVHAATCLAAAVLRPKIGVSNPGCNDPMADWLETKDGRLHTSDYFLACGDLAPARSEIARLPVLKEVQELMDAQWQCEKPPSYGKFLQAIAQQKPLTRQQIRLDTEAKVQTYFQRFAQLHQSVAAWSAVQPRSDPEVGWASR